MAQRLALHYFPGHSLLHRWDGRCKFLALLMMTATLLQVRVGWLVLNSIVLVVLFRVSGLPLKRLWGDVRGWMFFMGFLFLYHGFFTPGRRIDILPWVPISKEGIYFGSLTCWRLSVILGYAVLFTAVTRPREVRDSLVWLLEPVPFVPGRRIGLMVSLTLRFFSLILDQAEEIRLACMARLGDQTKRPLRKLKSRVLPIVHRSFSRVEDVTFALAARGYREDIKPEVVRLPLSHLIPLLFLLGALVLSWKLF
jgi:biotin transport system permease protein